MECEIVEVQLPNGATALVRARRLDDEPGTRDGATKTAFGDRLDFGDVGETLAGISETIRSALERAKPDETTVELAIELGVKSGKLTGLLVEGEGKGSLSITMRWGGA